MKKLTLRYKKILLYRSRREMARRASSAALVRPFAVRALGPTVFAPFLRRGRELVIEAPTDFHLTSNYEEVVKFLNSIRRMVILGARSRRLRRVIDLSPIRSIGLGAAVVLAAEADRWRRTLGIRPVPYHPESWSEPVKTMVDALGIFELMGPKPLPAYETSDGLLTMPLRTGDGPAEMGPEADDFLTCLIDLVGPLRGQQAFYDGICEAILNVCNHAYDPRFYRLSQPHWIGRRWWAAGGYDRPRKEITILVYDQGAGIPGTLPASKIWGAFRRALLGDPSDADVIDAALRYRITRTEAEERGEGLA